MDIQSINWDNKEEVIKAVKEDGYLLVYAKKFQNDKEVCLAAISNNSEAIRDVDKSLLGDKEFMMETVKYSNNAKNYRLDASSLIYASEELKKDKEFVLEVVKQRGEALQYADYFKTDKDVVIAAVRNNGFALEYADKMLWDEKEVVLEAVKNKGFSLMYAGPNMKNDKEVVMTALKQIRKEIDEVIEAGEVINSALNEIIEDPDEINEVGEFEEDDRTFDFDYIGEQLLQDEEFMKEARIIMEGQSSRVKEGNDYCNLEYASEEILDDEDIVSAALSQHTSEEIADGINPSVTEIEEVTKEMIEAQTLEKNNNDKEIEE